MTIKNNVLGNNKREKIAGDDERRMMTGTAGARRVAGIMLYMIVWG